MIFNLRRKWFDMIARGEKTVEYRELKPYWASRLAKLAPGDEIVFRLGYSKGHDINAVFDFIDIGKCPYKGWVGDFYRIHFTVKDEESCDGETVDDIVREMLDYDGEIEEFAYRIDCAHKCEIGPWRTALEKVEDQLRWTIAHIKAGEYDDVTGAMYTAECALEHIKRAREAAK